MRTLAFLQNNTYLQFFKNVLTISSWCVEELPSRPFDISAFIYIGRCKIKLISKFITLYFPDNWPVYHAPYLRDLLYIKHAPTMSSPDVGILAKWFRCQFTLFSNYDVVQLFKFGKLCENVERGYFVKQECVYYCY